MIDLRPRRGKKPSTTDTNPHQQLDQNSPVDVHESLKSRVFDFPRVDRRPSIISVMGAEALWLTGETPHRCEKAFMAGNEFAHVHPPHDGSLHMMLPTDLVSAVIEAGWGEPHPLALTGAIPETAVMIFAPRDAGEIETVLGLVAESHRFAVEGGGNTRRGIP